MVRCVRDKLWFYGSARWQTNQNYIAGLYYNKNEGDPTKWTYEADTSRRGFFCLEQNGVNLRLTSQVAQKHKLSFYYDNQSRIWDDTRAGVSPESAVAYRFPVLNLAQAAWTAPMTNKLLLEARYARRGEAFGNQLPRSRRHLSRHDPRARAVARTSSIAARVATAARAGCSATPARRSTPRSPRCRT